MNILAQFFANTANKDLATFIVAVYAAIVSTLNFAWPRLKDWEAERKAIFRALQGEKEAISDVAMQVIDGKHDSWLHRRPAFRKRLIHALSMAFVLESSDRAKAYVVAAFEYVAKDEVGRSDLVEQLKRIETIYTKYNSIVADKDFREKRLGRLKLVISHLDHSDAAQSTKQ